jgi:hypothetical protein
MTPPVLPKQVPWTPPPRPTTLEEIGMTAGSALLVTPEEAARREAELAVRLEAQNRQVDSVLDSTWRCVACGQPEASTDVQGRRLCGPCRSELANQEAEAARTATKISEVDRVRLVGEYRRAG